MQSKDKKTYALRNTAASSNRKGIRVMDFYVYIRYADTSALTL